MSFIESIKSELTYYKARVDNGKGTWGKPGYIKDDDWIRYTSYIHILKFCVHHLEACFLYFKIGRVEIIIRKRKS